jgi:hypothetical protein
MERFRPRERLLVGRTLSTLWIQARGAASPLPKGAATDPFG